MLLSVKKIGLKLLKRLAIQLKMPANGKQVLIMIAVGMKKTQTEIIFYVFLMKVGKTHFLNAAVTLHVMESYRFWTMIY